MTLFWVPIKVFNFCPPEGNKTSVSAKRFSVSPKKLFQRPRGNQKVTGYISTTRLRLPNSHVSRQNRLLSIICLRLKDADPIIIFARYDLTVCVGHLALSNTSHHAVIPLASDLFPCLSFPLILPSIFGLKSFKNDFNPRRQKCKLAIKSLFCTKTWESEVQICPKEESSWDQDGPFRHTWGHHLCGLPFAFCWEKQSSWERKSQTGWNLLFCYSIWSFLVLKKRAKDREKTERESSWGR